MILQRGIRTVPPEKSIQYRLDDRPLSNSHFGVGRTTKGSKFQGKASTLKKNSNSNQWFVECQRIHSANQELCQVYKTHSANHGLCRVPLTDIRRSTNNCYLI